MSVREPHTAGGLVVEVDGDVCQGHARCWQICPEVFALDEEGHAVVATGAVPPGMEDRVRDAADNCPERAIRVRATGEAPVR